MGLAGGGRATHREGRGPTLEPRRDLCMLVSADRPRRRAQIRRGAVVIVVIGLLPLHFPSCCRCVRGWASLVEEEATQACGAVDDGAPNRYGLGKCVGEALASARRVYENESGPIPKRSGRGEYLLRGDSGEDIDGGDIPALGCDDG
jgi:hypothetical protein